jgi:hypothetical protein
VGYIHILIVGSPHLNTEEIRINSIFKTSHRMRPNRACRHHQQFGIKLYGKKMH